MKKNAFLVLFILLIIAKANAQNYLIGSSYQAMTKEFWGGRFSNMSLGFKFSPSITFNSLDASKDFKNMSSGSAQLRMTVGPIADFYFAEKYAFSTGLWYTAKGLSYNVYNGFYDSQVFVQKPLTSDEIKASSAEFNLQYLQVPLTIKMFSGQVIPDMPMFIQFGGTLDVKIAEKAINPVKNALVHYRDRVDANSSIYGFGSANLLLGIGFEKPFGQGTDALFFGLQYQRGLGEINRGNAFDNLATKTGQLVIDFGIKF